MSSADIGDAEDVDAEDEDVALLFVGAALPVSLDCAITGETPKAMIVVARSSFFMRKSFVFYEAAGGLPAGKMLSVEAN
ncbi:hypothetical protein VQ042_23700 [Aurantimonas sp. A2-1-M11]|uniref:hypothetical protein n=1 Tax=Aurantimonas sp. A2-1-M11 TaxID=3113712 RepID=UPI002F9297D4